MSEGELEVRQEQERWRCRPVGHDLRSDGFPPRSPGGSSMFSSQTLLRNHLTLAFRELRLYGWALWLKKGSGHKLFHIDHY